MLCCYKQISHLSFRAYKLGQTLFKVNNYLLLEFCVYLVFLPYITLDTFSYTIVLSFASFPNFGFSHHLYLVF